MVPAASGWPPIETPWGRPDVLQLPAIVATPSLRRPSYYVVFQLASIGSARSAGPIVSERGEKRALGRWMSR